MKKYFLLVLLILLSGCVSAPDKDVNSEKADKAVKYEIYPDHLDFLCENVTLPNGKESLLTHIYCEAPDYKYTPAPGEGISCIDDVARAGVFYLDYYKNTGKEVYYDKVKRCAEFVLYLHQLDKNVSGYGYFYNFVDRKEDKLLINESGITSKAEPNWWTWRAIWFLGYIYPQVKDETPELAGRIKNALDITVAQMASDFTFEGDIKIEKGMRYADWLPNYAADQAAIILMALVDYYKIQPDEKIKSLMVSIADGLLVGQVSKNKNSVAYGAFLCWKNIWHGWGNNIAYSLLLAGEELKNQKYIDAALLEIDYFQEFLIKSDYLKEFFVKYTSDKGVTVITETERKFEQIAYAMRPMIYAALKAYEITGEKLYMNQAETLAGWFFGKNPANVKMYNPKSELRKGLVFDGINSDKDWNENYGAESTIECLLALQKLQTVRGE